MQAMWSPSRSCGRITPRGLPVEPLVSWIRAGPGATGLEPVLPPGPGLPLRPLAAVGERLLEANRQLVAARLGTLAEQTGHRPCHGSFPRFGGPAAARR